MKTKTKKEYHAIMNEIELHELILIIKEMKNLSPGQNQILSALERLSEM